MLVATFTLSNPGIDETVLRSVGGIAVRSDQLAADEFQEGAFGMIVVSDIAAAAGIASIPDPVSDIDDDGWFVYVPFQQAFTFSSAAGFDARGATWYPFDSRAKRKVEDGSTIAVVVANANSATGLQIGLGFRMLSMVTGT